MKTDAEIRILLTIALDDAENLLTDIARENGSLGIFKFVETGMRQARIFLDAERPPNSNELVAIRNFGIFAAKELSDSDEPLRGRIFEIGSLVTRLAVS